MARSRPRRATASAQYGASNFLLTVSPQKSLRAKKARCREHRAFFAQRPSPLTSRGRTTSKARRGRLHEGAQACTPDRASAHPGRRSAMALPLLSLSIPPSHWSGAGGTASDACRNAPSRRISKTSAADRPRGRDARRRGCVSSASICAVGSRSRADLHRLARDAYSILRSRAAEHPASVTPAVTAASA